LALIVIMFKERSPHGTSSSSFPQAVWRLAVAVFMKTEHGLARTGSSTLHAGCAWSLGEHLAQAIQIFALGWPRPQAKRYLGLWYPWLIKSESDALRYAVVMLIGIWTLAKRFTGKGLNGGPSRW